MRKLWIAAASVCLCSGGSVAAASAADPSASESVGTLSDRLLESAELRSLLLRETLERRIEAHGGRQTFGVMADAAYADRAEGTCPKTRGSS